MSYSAGHDDFTCDTCQGFTRNLSGWVEIVLEEDPETGEQLLEHMCDACAAHLEETDGADCWFFDYEHTYM